MKMDWAKLLSAVEPHGARQIIAGFAASMDQCVARAELTSHMRLAHFIAQCAHESDGFRTTVEYASGNAYEGRKDLGNTHVGDGRRFRGRGLIQLTGRANYTSFGAALGVANPALQDAPGKAAEFPLAALMAAEFWARHKINVGADRDDVPAVTRIINGGQNGLAERIRRTTAAKKALASAGV